jgi:DNA-binding SARP family transcriptional activator
MLAVQLLGRIRVWHDGTEVDLGPPGRQALFGLLALAAGHPVTRRDLVDALWPHAAPRTATNVLQTYVKHLRRVVDPHRPARSRSAVLPAVGDGYALHIDGDAVDVHRFRELAGTARSRERAGDVRGAVAAYGAALALWHGPPLVDAPALADHPQVTVLVVQHRQALARYGDLMIASNRSAEALAVLVGDAVRHPLDESAQARLLRACHAAGQRDRAFAVYESTRRSLAEELGVGPGQHLVAAYRDLLRDDAVPAAARAARTDPAAPG